VARRAGVASNSRAVIEAAAARSTADTRNNNVSDTTGQIAQLGQALANCASQFSVLGSWIKKQVEENMDCLMDSLAVDVPKMYEEFKSN